MNLQRNFQAGENERLAAASEMTANGTSDVSMRNQFRAWAEFMRPE